MLFSEHVRQIIYKKGQNNQALSIVFFCCSIWSIILFALFRIPLGVVTAIISIPLFINFIRKPTKKLESNFRNDLSKLGNPEEILSYIDALPKRDVIDSVSNKNVELRFDDQYTAYADNKSVYIFRTKDLYACYILHVPLDESIIILRMDLFNTRASLDALREFPVHIKDSAVAETIFLELQKNSILYQEQMNMPPIPEPGEFNKGELIYNAQTLTWKNPKPKKNEPKTLTYRMDQLVLGYQTVHHGTDDSDDHYVILYMDDYTHIEIIVGSPWEGYMLLLKLQALAPQMVYGKLPTYVQAYKQDPKSLKRL